MLPAEAQSALLARAGGNPLYAEQFVRMLLERGHEDLPLPENVQGIIAARLDGLDAGDKALLQAAAVFGKVFWLGAVAAVARRARRASRSACTRSSARSSSAASGARPSRPRPSTRSSTCSCATSRTAQMPRAARAERHLLAAGWMESLGRSADHADMLAHHFSAAAELARSAGRSTPELEARARRALTEAGDRAMSLGAMPAAAQVLRAGPRLLPARHAGARGAAPAHRPQPSAPIRTFDDAVLEEASEGLAAAGDLDGAAEARLMMAGNCWVRGSSERVWAQIDAAQALVPEGTISPIRVNPQHGRPLLDARR